MGEALAALVKDAPTLLFGIQINEWRVVPT